MDTPSPPGTHTQSLENCRRLRPCRSRTRLRPCQRRPWTASPAQPPIQAAGLRRACLASAPLRTQCQPDPALPGKNAKLHTCTLSRVERWTWISWRDSFQGHCKACAPGDTWPRTGRRHGATQIVSYRARALGGPMYARMSARSMNATSMAPGIDGAGQFDRQCVELRP